MTPKKLKKLIELKGLNNLVFVKSQGHKRMRKKKFIYFKT